MWMTNKNENDCRGGLGRRKRRKKKKKKMKKRRQYVRRA
jgi:hypothetical protein